MSRWVYHNYGTIKNGILVIIKILPHFAPVCANRTLASYASLPVCPPVWGSSCGKLRLENDLHYAIKDTKSNRSMLINLPQTRNVFHWGLNYNGNDITFVYCRVAHWLNMRVLYGYWNMDKFQRKTLVHNTFVFSVISKKIIV